MRHDKLRGEHAKQHIPPDSYLIWDPCGKILGLQPPILEYKALHRHLFSRLCLKSLEQSKTLPAHIVLVDFAMASLEKMTTRSTTMDKETADVSSLQGVQSIAVCDGGLQSTEEKRLLRKIDRWLVFKQA